MFRWKKYLTDKIVQVKSKIGSTLRQKRTLQALGLKKTNASVEVEATPQILGMVEKVKHLVKVTEL
jgi:large subunit ribosomal protein L30